MNTSQSHTKEQEHHEQPFIEMELQPSVSIEFKVDSQIKPVPLEGTEKEALLFIATAIYHIFKRTRANAGLSDRVIATYISRLVTQTRKGLTVIEGHVPRLEKARSLAKSVVNELEL
ncbi:hypothetical protein JOB18_049366, partial [Solea senegalensis]